AFHLRDGDLPANTDTLIVTGAQEVVIEMSSMSGLKDVRHIHLTSNQFVTMKSFTAVDLNIVNLYIDIKWCTSLDIEPQAFNKLR
ncbi:jg23156, partial [Pararge aegeria aegeria]